MPKEKKKEKWLCPITKKCSTRTLHRRCKSCKNHCWDCCAGCSGRNHDGGMGADCPGEAGEPIADLPDDAPHPTA